MTPSFLDMLRDRIHHGDDEAKQIAARMVQPDPSRHPRRDWLIDHHLLRRPVIWNPRWWEYVPLVWWMLKRTGQAEYIERTRKVEEQAAVVAVVKAAPQYGRQDPIPVRNVTHVERFLRETEGREVQPKEIAAFMGERAKETQELRRPILEARAKQLADENAERDRRYGAIRDKP